MMGNVRDTVNVMSTVLVQHDVAEQSLASVRPMVREGVRKALRENGLADMAESLYLCDTSEDDLRAIRETDVGREMWQVVQVIMHEKKGQLEDVMAGLISWQDSEEDTIRSMRAMIRVLMRKPSMGRVLSLLGFNGWAAVKLSSRGVQFVSAVMAAVEDEEHTCITNWIERGGGKDELRQRFCQGQQQQHQREHPVSDQKGGSAMTKLAILAGCSLVVGYICRS